MRGSIEMNTLKQIASRAIVFVLALSVLVPALIVAGDNNVVQAEKLAAVSLTNKGTGYTTEASPPSSRSAPSSRTNASTVYVTMADVSTTNAVSNSHIINANKVVITVVESDFNTKVDAISGSNNFTDGTVGDNAAKAAAANLAANKTNIFQGAAGMPVIDTDSDGDLTDEPSFKLCAKDNTVSAYNNATGVITCSATARATVFQTVSVANGASATTTAKPMITTIVTTADAANDNDEDFAYVAYQSSAVNTFQVKAWSTVQLEANASLISVVETGRNTGVFEAEFVVADTEGANDNLAEATNEMISNAANNDTACAAASGSGAVVSNIAGSQDGRFDAFSGTNADCEILLQTDVDLSAADLASGATGVTLALGTLPAGDKIYDSDQDGSLLDEIYLAAGSAEALTGNNLAKGATFLTLLCGGSATNCTDGTGGAITATANLGATAINGAEDGSTDDTADVLISVINNVVDTQKVDTDAGNTVTTSDLKTGRVGSDTVSTGGSAQVVNGNYKTGVFTTGVDRTPVVEAQANATITVQYQDLTDNSTSTTATTGTKVKATVTVDVSAPSPVVSTPTSGSSFKDRQPTFTGSVTDIGSGLDVSTTTLYVDMLNDTASTGLTDAITTTLLTEDADGGSSVNTKGTWLGAAGSINLQDRYDAMAVALDNTTTMVDGVTSVTWTVATSANIPCSTGTADGTNEAGIVNTGASTHTNFAGAISCDAALATPDVVVDYALSATDLAGNRGFSDSKSTDTDTTAVGDPYTLNIDELKPSLCTTGTETGCSYDTRTGTYYNAGTYAEKTGDATRIRVSFNDEIGSVSASSFEVTKDDGSVVTPTAAEIGPNGTDAAGASFDFRKNVYLTLPSSLASSDTPKVKLVGDVADLAGNATKAGSISNIIDKVKPALTLALSGGSGTGASDTANDSDSLTKSAMTFTITTDEVLSSPPTISIFDESYGTGGAYADLGDEAVDQGGNSVTAAGSTGTVLTVSAQTIIDTDKDGSLVDEVVLQASDTATSVTAAELVGITVTAVANSGENVLVTISNSVAIPAGSKVRVNGNTDAAINASHARVAAEGTVTAVAQDSKSYTATFSGSSFSDAAANDTKAVVVSATDASTSQNTGTVGVRDQGSSSVYKFRLDKTAPVLKNDPDGDGTVGSTTTLPRPYVIFEFTDNSNVTVVSASFGGDDVLASLATTNNKKYFMVPDADLTSKTYAVKAKGTDLAGNKGAEGTYNLKVTSRKDYKATILAGWNLMSFPSDPVSNDIGSVFTNSGIDQVVGYDAMAKGSPWQVGTKDSASGTFSGSLSSISSGNGYWVHSDEFSSQAVALTGPEGPSASAPPSIPSIELASGWNLVGVVDATKSSTQADEGAVLKEFIEYLGANGGSSVTKAYEYNTSDLAWVEIDTEATGDTTDAKNANIGEAYWVFATPAASGLLTPIVP